MTTFTSDWFTSSIPPWRRHVVPVLAGRENVRWLEVGTHEGRSALWTLDNVLTGRGSSITCVDKWEGLWMQKCAEERRFDLECAAAGQLAGKTFPIVCPCECFTCSRAWSRDGMPIVRDGKIVRHP